MSDRGMKKWAPYKSLVEQEEFIHKMNVERLKTEKPILMDDEINKINQFLNEKPYNSHIFSFYEDGYIYKVLTKIKRIDMNEQSILFENNLKIDVSDLINIED